MHKAAVVKCVLNVCVCVLGVGGWGGAGLYEVTLNLFFAAL